MVRRATADDVPSITAVLFASFVEYETFYTAEAFKVATPSAEHLHQRMSEGPYWVALQKGIILGTISGVLQNKAVYIRSIAILPTARGQHLGRLLLEEVEAFASQQRAERLFLSTASFLTRAISLYEQFGFLRSNEGPHTLFGTPIFTMMKEPNSEAKDDAAPQRQKSLYKE
jgi:N-acetylglutamate synthase-like GNAT family acetyltransferase